MPAPTDFEIKVAEECNGGPWPDLSAITFKSSAVVAPVQLDSATRRRALADPDIQRVISYADPTGETAVRNVLRVGGAR